MENGRTRTYFYCKECYEKALSNGFKPSEVAKARLLRRGKECDVCKTAIEDVKRTSYFGCPDCYREMRDEARNIISACQRPVINSDISGVNVTPKEVAEFAVSSRIRLARNIEGATFSSHDFAVTNILVKGAKAAGNGVFNLNEYYVLNMSDMQKRALFMLRLVSLPLINNERNGVFVLESGKGELSVMVNEEDRLRVQCILDGFSLRQAYEKIKTYDGALQKALPIAKDAEFGYLTACPTNVGTGMRASVMLFLTGLQRLGVMEQVKSVMKRDYGVTVRGAFGEGSDGTHGLYQVSNDFTAYVRETDILSNVEAAAIRLCSLEKDAIVKLLKTQRGDVIDRIFRSYQLLSGAYKFDVYELLSLISDVRLGVILGNIPIRKISTLNRITTSCGWTMNFEFGKLHEEEIDIERAKRVKDILAEEIC